MREEDITGENSGVDFTYYSTYPVVTLLEGDNKYKKGCFQEVEVAGETGGWPDVGAFKQDSQSTVMMQFNFIYSKYYNCLFGIQTISVTAALVADK